MKKAKVEEVPCDYQRAWLERESVQSKVLENTKDWFSG